MSKSSDRAEREAAARERAAASAAQQALITQINTPDPLVQKYKDMVSKRLDFFNQGSPNYDLSQTDKEGKPIFPGGPVFADAATREARAQRESQRTGLGAIQLGSHGAAPGMIANMREQGMRQRSQDASLSAADAVNQARAETFGSVLPIGNYQNQRLGLAAGATGDWRSATEQRWANRPTSVPWWQVAAGLGSSLGSAAITHWSDVNIKQDFEPINAKAILDRVTSLPLTAWTYSGDGNVRHIGPMAQDFAAAFNVGADNRMIAAVDMNGVALAAIQALAQEVAELRAMVGK
jgi:hypothetical protein